MKIKEALSFDDVLIVPKYSTVVSRKNVDISNVLDEKLGIKLDCPLIASPMDSISEHSMAVAMADLGGMAIIHRYLPIKEQCDIVEKALKGIKVNNKNIGAAIGVTGDYLDRAKCLIECLGVKCIAVDTAHGHHILVEKCVKSLIDKYGDSIHIMAGNVATRKGFEDLSSWGSKSVRVGIGSGCFGKGTRILMSNGTYKNIEDVKLHDKVINENGKSVEVIGTKFSGFKKVMKYKNTAFHDFSYATSDHLHRVPSFSGKVNDSKGLSRRINSEAENTWMQLSDCKEKVFILPLKIDFELEKTFKIDLKGYTLRDCDFKCVEKKYTDIEPSYELGYVFGTFLGDGCVQMSHCARKVIDKDGKEKKN